MDDLPPTTAPHALVIYGPSCELEIIIPFGTYEAALADLRERAQAWPVHPELPNLDLATASLDDLSDLYKAFCGGEESDCYVDILPLTQPPTSQTLVLRWPA